MNNENFKYNFSLLSLKFRFPILFCVGVGIAVIVNFISDCQYTDRLIDNAESALTSLFREKMSSEKAFFELILSVKNDLIFLIIVAIAGISVFSRSAISAAVILKGYTWGRFAGAVLAIASPIPSFIALSFSAAICILILSYAELSAELCDSLRSDNKNREIYVLISPEFTSCATKFLVTFGSIILLSLIKSFLLWLYMLI